LLLEGKSITALLAQVRAEHGDDVTIVAAEKVRSGGLGGFFAKESYALTVEVDGPAPSGAAPSGDVPSGAVPSGAVQSGMDAPVITTRRTNGTPNGQAGMDAPVRDVQAPGSLLDLAAAIDEAEAAENSVILATRPMHRTAPEPVLSTASPEFASILARLTALDAPQPGATPEPVPVPAPTSAPTRVDAYTRLRDVLAEIAPDVDFTTGVPMVLVIPPGMPAPVPAASVPADSVPAASVPVASVPADPLSDPAAVPAPVIPRQGRHRRAQLA
jgi:hypothetical protein